ncbi:YbaB/EbfC family nucleoid-associated protein [Catenuloplanes atrovinosus]|uniref:DNA-binding protein YbaB n=1 Tax=Catenuloplanes atrovinosus TaxID=137266 RepID=A0AAE3YN68_9ACTN|nr:YbaB/EbfC family nucleoid-associated protein [Catenuloplanes atrovinosus]MDR7276605.1 DNA-binding protein YbaB [Catenuloplanes atrovinosus]
MLDATVGALRATGAEPEDEETARLRRIGESEDGQVRAEFGADGRLESLVLDPRVMRLGSAEVGDRVIAAVNAAIDSMRGTAQVPAPGDLSQLAEQLEQVRDTAVPRLSAFLQTLTEAQQRMAGGGSR